MCMKINAKGRRCAPTVTARRLERFPGKGTAYIRDVGGFVGGLHLLVVIFIVVFTIQLLTELTSNTATAATFLPLMGALAVGQLVSGNVDLASQGSAAVILAVPTAISASCAFMMPVATPPNAIVFGLGKMKISSMIRNGFLLTFFSTSVVALLSYYLVPLIW